MDKIKVIFLLNAVDLANRYKFYFVFYTCFILRNYTDKTEYTMN